MWQGLNLPALVRLIYPLLLVVSHSVKDLVRDRIGLLLRNKGLLGSTGLRYVMEYTESPLEIPRQSGIARLLVLEGYLPAIIFGLLLVLFVNFEAEMIPSLGLAGLELAVDTQQILDLCRSLVG